MYVSFNLLPCFKTLLIWQIFPLRYLIEKIVIGTSHQVVTIYRVILNRNSQTENGMNTGNPLYFRTSSRMENKSTVELIHCFTGKKHAPDSLFGYLWYWKTTKPRIWETASLTLISLRLDWSTCALTHEIKQYSEKRKTFIPLQYSSPMAPG